MTRTEFYNGWQITIFDYGDLDNPTRIMMAFGQNGKQIDFSGYVINDDKAIEGAKFFIDHLEENQQNLVSVTVKNDDIDDFPEVIGD